MASLFLGRATTASSHHQAALPGWQATLVPEERNRKKWGKIQFCAVLQKQKFNNDDEGKERGKETWHVLNWIYTCAELIRVLHSDVFQFPAAADVRQHCSKKSLPTFCGTQFKWVNHTITMIYYNASPNLTKLNNEIQNRFNAKCSSKFISAIKLCQKKSILK